MEIKFPENIDPLSNVIEFTRKKREPLLEMQPSRYDSCHHDRTTISEEKRTVRCRDCDTLLDPFQVLWQMAIKERRWLSDLETWEARRDSLLGERYDAEWIKHVEDVVDPPSNPRLREIWDTFHAYMGDKFCAMYRRKHRKTKGTLWYGRDVRGSCVSIEYVRSQLAPKLIATKEAQ